MQSIPPSAARELQPLTPLEMWGGVECTVNRVGDVYFEQMRRNGHLERANDIERFADLGIRAVRYPVLWEQVAPTESGAPDWSWPDERLGLLRAAELRPIVGLTHHGSGPRHTSLVDPAYPTKLARFARSVAERYPWLTDFTPVNEPLTTARFSGLYGHWYPHGRDGAALARALVNQCRAVALSMAAVREVIPGARLVQTEDLGRIFSSSRLAYIAEFQNERRWLSLDLLCGRVDRQHLFWPMLRSWGVAEEELESLLERPCPPDIMGINHYLTSDRFLDDDLTPYPESRHHRSDANGDAHYADVEAVRACIECPVGTCSVLREAYDRYQLPLAVTEAHLAATREDQLRWLYEVWDGANRLRRSGIDVRAVTAWSLLGAFDWNVLVTRTNGFYEPGVFDIRAPEPRPTALARLVRDLATTGQPADEPLLTQTGWWHRSDRLFHAASSHGRSVEEAPLEPALDMEAVDASAAHRGREGHARPSLRAALRRARDPLPPPRARAARPHPPALVRQRPGREAPVGGRQRGRLRARGRRRARARHVHLRERHRSGHARRGLPTARSGACAGGSWLRWRTRSRGSFAS